MKRLAKLVACTALLAAALPAGAEEGGAFAPKNFTGTVTMATDYVFRGVSQTDQGPTIQGSFDYAHPVGVYLGVWGSNVAFARSLEVDYYGGFRNTVWDALSYDLGAVYYSYPKARGESAELDYWEVYLGLSYALPLPLEPTIGAKYAYSPDFTGEDGDGHYLNGSLKLKLPMEFGLGLEVGYQDVEGDQTTSGYDYTHYKVAVSKSLVGFGLELSYQDSDIGEDEPIDENLADQRIVFAVSRSL